MKRRGQGSKVQFVSSHPIDRSTGLCFHLDSPPPRALARNSSSSRPLCLRPSQTRWTPNSNNNRPPLPPFPQIAARQQDLPSTFITHPFQYIHQCYDPASINYKFRAFSTAWTGKGRPGERGGDVPEAPGGFRGALGAGQEGKPRPESLSPSWQTASRPSRNAGTGSLHSPRHSAPNSRYPDVLIPPLFFPSL